MSLKKILIEISKSGDAITHLNSFCQLIGYEHPVYTLEGPEVGDEVKVKVAVLGQTFPGVSTSKKSARVASARKALANLVVTNADIKNPSAMTKINNYMKKQQQLQQPQQHHLEQHHHQHQHAYEEYEHGLPIIRSP